MRFRFSFALTALLAAAPLSAQTLLTNNVINGTTRNFSALTANTFLPTASLAGFTIDPISDIEFYAVGEYGLGDNGNWSSVGAAGGVGTSFGFGSFMRFTFDTPVSAVGGTVNYCLAGGLTCNGFSATLRAYDDAFNLLGSWDIDALAPILTPGLTNSGAFRGVSMNTASIKYLDWGGSYVTMSDITTGVAAPEPVTLSLVGGGLVFLGALRIRRRRA